MPFTTGTLVESPIPTGVGGNAYFDALAASPYVHQITIGPYAGQPASFSLRSQAQIDSLSGVPPNAYVKYPPDYPDPQLQDAAQVVIKGDDHPDVIADPAQFMNGTPLAANLYPSFFFDMPTGGNRYLVTWDVFYGDGFAEQIHSAGNPWHGLKTCRFVARDPATTSIGNIFKTAVNFTPLWPSPAFGHNWSQITAEFPIGPNVTRREPLEPNDWAGFPLEAGKWLRYWVLFEESATDFDTVSAWVADETRDPHLAVDHLQVELPWNVEKGEGVQGIELRFSPKSARTSGNTITLYWRNLIVLKNHPDILSLLVKPT